MNENERAAYIMSQSACAIVQALGMMSDNLQRLHRGESIAYPVEVFVDSCQNLGITHNQVMAYFQGI